jgi:lipoprotein-releasing system permease protein
MNLSFLFAKKYFYSKKVRNVINIISLISQIGLAVSTAAMIIILSVFNGLEDLLLSLHDQFDSDLKIESVEGKYFKPDSVASYQIKNLEGLESMTEVIEEVVLLSYQDNQTIGTIKGISREHFHSLGLSKNIKYGEAKLSKAGLDQAVVGIGIAAKLDISLSHIESALKVYFPKKGKASTFYLNPENAFIQKFVYPSGIFQIQQDFDDKYIIASNEFVRELVGEDNQVTAVEINFSDEKYVNAYEASIQEMLGENFRVLNRQEQHDFLYKITRNEKFIVFLILALVLVIASFNLIATVLVLALEKKKDMMVLQTMGTETKTIKRIFVYEGLLIAFSAAIAGILLGTLICYLQMQFGLIKLGGEDTTFVVDAFPVSMKLSDVLIVSGVVIIIGFLSSYLPVRKLGKRLHIKDLHK